MSDLLTALKLAEEVHGEQKYGGLPYMYHIYGVLNRVREKYGKEEAKYSTGREHLAEMEIVAVLHDYLEDGGSLETLRRSSFSDTIISACLLMTHVTGFTYDEYIDTLGRADSVAGFLARAVKYEDMRFNLANNPRPKNRDKYTYYIEVLNQWNLKSIQRKNGGYRP